MGSQATWDGQEPIAIVGLGCRMPGHVRNPRDFWNLMMSKGIGNSAKVPSSRFNIDAYYHPTKERPGSFNISGGYFLDDDLEGFDPGMFRLSPLEAMNMDPQQRKLLEVVYETFENAGISLEQVGRRKTGCFAATFSQDYLHMNTKEPDFRLVYAGVGVDNGMLANRMSYCFDLRGPSVMLNTACSSSMYAIHLACQSMAAGDCDGAIIGATNLIMSVDQQMNTAKLGTLSPTNQCHSFDQAADGYGRAESVGALYIRPLSSAIRDGDPIRAVIRGTAANCNGIQDDLIAHPSIDGQVDVILSAYQRANLSLSETSYFECHGTGTPVGDPIEVNAIHRAMDVSGCGTHPLLIGSVKPNIGHSEPVSSIATLIKATLALEQGLIPPTAGISVLNPKIPWEKYGIKVVQDATSSSMLPAPLRRISVNAFGYGGTNSHTILESARSFFGAAGSSHRSLISLPGSVPVGKTSTAESPVHPSHEDFVLPTESHQTDDSPHLLVFSAHDEPTLRNMVQEYSTLNFAGSKDLLDLAYTLGTHRTKFSWKAFSIVRKRSFDSSVLGALKETRSVEADKIAKPAFVFTGQGAQWAQMGISLLKFYPCIVGRTIQELDNYLSELDMPPSWTIESLLRQAESVSAVNEAEFSQPLCTAVQIALVDLLSHWGVRPLATVGHSSGEIAAAYASGKISAITAIKAAYFRGKTAASLRKDGAMLAVGLGAAEISAKYLDRPETRDGVVVACHNSPDSTTLSGDRKAIERLKVILDEAHVFNRMLKTDGRAYHSHHVKEAAKEYLQQLQDSSSKSTRSSGQGLLPEVPMFSTVKNTELEADEVSDSYWASNLASPVLFDEGVRLLLNSKPEVNTLIEIGPHSALAGPIRQILSANGRVQDVTYLPTLKRGEHDADQLLSLAGNLWARNASIDMQAVLERADTLRVDASGNGKSVDTMYASLLVDLPPYRWTYTKNWWDEGRSSKEHRQMLEPRHDILGRRLHGASPLEPTWRNILRQKDLPWLCHHRLAGEVLFPGTGYLALAIEAVTQINDHLDEPIDIKSYSVRDVVCSTATVIPDDDSGTETLFRMQPVQGKSTTGNLWYNWTASSCSYGTWKEAARGSVAVNIENKARARSPPTHDASWRKTKHLDWIEKLRSVGVEYGPTFRHTEDVFVCPDQRFAQSDMVYKRECGLIEGESRYLLHPGFIDACMQTTQATFYDGNPDNLRCGTVLTHIDEASFFVPSEDLSRPCQMRIWTESPLANRSFTSDGQLMSPDGLVLFNLSGLRQLRYRTAIPEELKGPMKRDLYLREEWKPDAEYLDETSRYTIPAIVDIMVHKNPEAGRILVLEPELLAQFLPVPSGLVATIAVPSTAARHELEEKYRDYKNIAFLEIDLNASRVGETSREHQDFDLIISGRPIHRDAPSLRIISELLSSDGGLLFQKHGDTLQDIQTALKLGGSMIKSVRPVSDDVLLARVDSHDKVVVVNGESKGSEAARPKHVMLVYQDETETNLVDSISSCLEELGWIVSLSSLEKVDITTAKNEETKVVFLDTAQDIGSLLKRIDDSQLQTVIQLMESTSSMTWVTSGGLLAGECPEFALIVGAARTIRKEKRSLDLVTLDYDAQTTSNQRLAAIASDVLERQHTQGGRNGETEYCVQGGVVHVGRVLPHTEVNSELVPDSGITRTARQQDGPPAVVAHLAGATGEVIFSRDEDVGRPLQPDEVEVQTLAIGLTAEDGADDTTFLSHQVVGKVSCAGDSVKADFPPGSLVMGLVASFDGRLSTFQRTTASLLLPVTGKEHQEDMIAMATIPSAFATAIHALEELAQVDCGQHVVIVDGLGAVGTAALQICKALGVKVTVITTSEATEHLLQQRGFISSSCRVVRWTHAYQESEQGLRGALADGLNGQVDAILCSETVGETSILETLTPCFARNVSLVAIENPSGNSDARSKLLSSIAFIKGMSCFHLSLKQLATRHPRKISKALRHCEYLLREGKISSISPAKKVSPSKAFDIPVPEDIGSGVHVVSYADASFDIIGPHSRRLPLQFMEDATYLLVGCLGGLGRSVAAWMADRGAKHLAFLSRTGTSGSAEAAEFVENLQARGVRVMVLRADVTRLAELENAVADIESSSGGQNFPPIRGVLNAAAIIQDGLFVNQSSEAWHKVVQPKLQGCLNLDRVFSGTGATAAGLQAQPELDFFVMTSSVAATMGSAGQSSYAAANSFLDSLARRRRAQGLPGVSIILPPIFGIGYIAQHREIERAVTGKGMTGILEPEMLEAFEVAMLPQTLKDDPVGDHIIVGAQPRRWGATIRAAGIDPPWADDPRFSWVQVAVEEQSGHSDTNGKGSASQQPITQTIREGTDQAATENIVLEYVATRLSRLLMLDEVKHNAALSSQGLDSMIGAEFRNWLLREFGVNVPFQQLLSGNLNVAELAQLLCQQVWEQQREATETAGTG